MCRIPKVAIVAPSDVQADLRRKLSSLEYEIVAAVTSLEEIRGVTVDAVVLWEPDGSTIATARADNLKTVSVGGSDGADLHLETDDVASLKTRIWELFRPT